MKKVVILDYGSGNLLSIMRAVEASGGRAHLTGKPSEISAAEYIVIPGVGAFGECMRKLQGKGLIEPLLGSIGSGARVLGICVGMQILFDESEEFGMHRGLGVIPGRVVAILPAVGDDGTKYKVPHIGWNSLTQSGTDRWRGSILGMIDEGSCCYFVHSFMAVPDKKEDWLADTYYGKTRICAATQSGNIYGCQFHPEKSGPTGLNILINFLKL